MHCPSCRAQVTGSHCPQCGIKINPTGEDAQEKATASARQEPVYFDLSAGPSRGQESRTSDWRLQLRRRLSEHSSRKHRQDPIRRDENRDKGAEQTVSQARSKRPLFDYRLGDPARQSTQPGGVTFAGKTRHSQTVVEKPLIRAPVSARARPRSHLPKQQALTLESPAVRPPAGSSISEREETATSEIGLAHEVIFSRMLAGIIDLFLAVLIAFVFTFSASKILNFDFFSSNSLHLGVVFSLCFYFLNSFFFLVVSGQTQGMYLTDLQLVGEESESVSFQALVLRICLFLPVAATVVGLLWSVFDPWCRCVHDRLSKTRVVPITHGTFSSAHPAELSTSCKN